MKVERLAMSSSVGLGVSTGGEYLPARQVQHVQDAAELITHQAPGYYDRVEAAATLLHRDVVPQWASGTKSGREQFPCTSTSSTCGLTPSPRRMPY
ncbi:hypothetical protein ACFVY4_33615 [Streptomyces sp. NPDC058299]|uniref:hypothetical protein n=1 Tax=Streptomyces sp. NPDC058299 TaxID=3346435 RepID=UPI0036EA461A